jgi:hypothetical protein
MTNVPKLVKKFFEAINDLSLEQIFFNSDLGIPYSGKGVKLTPAILDECVDGYGMLQTYTGDRHIVMGVDVGNKLNVSVAELIGTTRRKIFIGTFSKFTQVNDLIKKLKVKCCVVDARPETRKVKEFRDANKKNLVWLCDYQRSDSILDAQVNEEDQTIKVDRTQSLDSSHKDYITMPQKVILPRNARSIDDGDFYKQMCAPTRIYNSDKNVFTWEEESKADHYRHADNYEKIAQYILQKVRVSDAIILTTRRDASGNIVQAKKKEPDNGKPVTAAGKGVTLNIAEFWAEKLSQPI